MLPLRSWLPARIVWPTVAAACGLTGARLLRVRPSRLGHDLALQLDPPSTTDDVRRSLGAIAVGFRAARCTMTTDDHRADRLVLHLHRIASLPPEAYPSDTRRLFLPGDPSTPVPLGLNDRGDLVSLPLLGRSLLIAGSPGSGKSNAIRCVLGTHGLSGRRNLAVVGIDPKRVELTLWRPRMAALVVGNEAAPTLELLGWLVDEVQRRAHFMADEGLIDLEPSHLHPAIVLVVDEWAEMAADGTPKQREEAHRLLRRFLALGRATGCSAVLATQRPTSDVIDTGTRALLAYRLALRSDRYGSEATLGTGHHEAATIAAGSPGVGYLTDGADVRRLQLFEVAADRVPDERCAGLHCPLDRVPSANRPDWFGDGGE